MIVDFHCHLGRLRGTERTAEALVAEMDRFGVDWAVVFPFAQAPDNELILRAAAAFPGRLIPFITVNPWDDESPERLQALVEAGARGLKLHPIAHGFPLDDHTLVDPLLDICATSGIPVIAHCTADVLSIPNSLGDLAKEYPSITFIMAHMGHMYDTTGAIATARRWPNIYLETSHAFYRSIRKAIREVGADRVILGSDSPFSDIDWELEKVTRAVDEQAVRSRVAGGTAAAILGVA